MVKAIDIEIVPISDIVNFLGKVGNCLFGT